MTSGSDDLSKFRDAFLDYLEGYRDDPPGLDDLPVEQRRAAEAFIASIMAARGIDPYSSRPSIEQLLASRGSSGDGVGNIADMLQEHLHMTVDPRALVTPDTASTSVGLASTLLIRARGMRIRVVPQATSEDLGYALTSGAESIASVFGAFPDTHAVLYMTTGEDPLAVIVDRGDAQGAIETPSGERRAPRLRRSIADPGTACELWLTGMIPNFEPLGPDLFDPSVAPESSLDAFHLASMAVDQVSAAGARAKIEAKRATWRDFGDREAQRLAAIVQEAQLGTFSLERYMSHLDEIVEVAA